jgi:hypothetical protein
LTVCEVCGNEFESAGSVCPYCGNSSAENTLVPPKKSEYIKKVVNLEAGRPTVETALARMIEIIEDAVRNNLSIITFIHGYGSSGKGGAIRMESRKMLEFLKSKGTIKEYIPGEDFNHRLGRVKAVLNRYPQLKLDKNLNKANRGITLVIL